MKKITDIKTQTKNSKRVSIYLDGVYYCGLDLFTAVKNRLKVGDYIDEEKLVEIQREGEFSACFDKALNLISRSVKTKKQITEKLIEKGYLKEIVDEVVVKLSTYNYVDDLDYSKRYVNTYKNAKGKRLIELELKQKGVLNKDIESALKSIENEDETAYNIALKYTSGKDINEKTFAKCYKYLISKGFSYEDSLSATKKVIKKESDNI